MTPMGSLIDDEYSKLPSASARYIARRKALGLCGKAACTAWPEDGRTLCRPHLDAQRDRVLARYYAKKKQKEGQDVGKS